MQRRIIEEKSRQKTFSKPVDNKKYNPGPSLGDFTNNLLNKGRSSTKKFTVNEPKIVKREIPPETSKAPVINFCCFSFKLQ